MAAGTYAVAWVAPARLPQPLLRSLMLALLIEFLVVHSAGFLGHALLEQRRSKRRRIVWLVGFGGVYLLFAAAFGMAFQSWAPVATFGWLIGSRVLTVLVDPLPGERERERQRALWGQGAILYLFAIFITAIVPLPRLGVDEAARARMDLPGSGLWIDEPWRVFAFGLLYFGLLAWVELRGERRH